VDGEIIMLKATMTRVIDGDTIEVTSTFHVRLDFIDAPETKGAEKPEGLKAKAGLQEILKPGDAVELDIKKMDMYDRPLSVVYKDGVNINGELLRKGFVEVYSPAGHNDGKVDVI
jgi:micrococcal nuclease